MINKSVCNESIYHDIFKSHAATLRNYIYYKCGNLQQAEDLVQDAFAKLWQNCAKVSIEKARGFLYKVSNNLFLNQIEKKKVALKFIKQIDTSQDNQTPQFLIEEKEFQYRLETAISALPEDQREIFLMNRIDKHKYREIADLLNISVKTVEKKMHQALVALRKIHKKV